MLNSNFLTSLLKLVAIFALSVIAFSSFALNASAETFIKDQPIELAQATETKAEEAARKKEERRLERERKRAERAAKRKKRLSRPRFGSFS